MARAEADLAALLARVQTIAIVGLSANPARPSHDVAAFLVARGYQCVGVNPGLAGRHILGMPVVGRLSEIGHPVDMVDIFRASDAAGGIVDEALALDPKPTVIWMQLGVIDTDARDRAEAAGVRVVMDNCPKLVLAGL
jgi:predicted CoA-binding protein